MPFMRQINMYLIFNDLKRLDLLVAVFLMIKLQQGKFVKNKTIS